MYLFSGGCSRAVAGVSPPSRGVRARPGRAALAPGGTTGPRFWASGARLRPGTAHSRTRTHIAARCLLRGRAYNTQGREPARTYQQIVIFVVIISLCAAVRGLSLKKREKRHAISFQVHKKCLQRSAGIHGPSHSV